VCDGNNLAATGLAVVDTMGPRGGAIHSSDEFLCADSLEERAKLAALVLLRVAQHGWKR
jgi:glutamate carboxypeptidase